MSDNQRCDQCRFWIESGGSDAGLVGECRRHAPTPVAADNSQAGRFACTRWPITAEDHWCGEFEQRAAATREILERVALIEKMEAERKRRRAGQ